MINEIFKYFMGSSPLLSIILGILTLFLVSTNWLDNGLMSYLIIQVKPFFLEVKLELINHLIIQPLIDQCTLYTKSKFDDISIKLDS